MSYEEVDVATTKALVTATTKAGVKKFVLLSAIGASGRGTPYQRAKWRCESIVRASSLNWVILRPSFIVGPERRAPQVLTPLFVALRYVPGLRRPADNLRPVHVNTLARALFAAIQKPGAIQEIWSGKEIWSA